MSDRRPCRNTEGWWRCRACWWLADRFKGRKILGRVSYPAGGFFIDGGKVDLDAIRRFNTDDVRMEVRFLDQEETPNE